MSVRELVSANTPRRFWRLAADAPDAAWDAAIDAALRTVPWPFPPPESLEALLEATLGEGQFGARRHELGRVRRAYYALVRPVLPASLRPLLRRVWRARSAGFPLGWPVEDRYVRFQERVLHELAGLLGVDALELHWFWPDRAACALCLTHDVETRAGHDFVPVVMELEERLGFRSSFNFVPGDYSVDGGLLRELRGRGFDFGIHGHRHDGRMFSSPQRFAADAAAINAVAARWETRGFRSPLTHRRADWMQALELDYDLSYFDTDPYEPMPGGTMSIWPFLLGRFVELPYTLPQDHTLFEMGRAPAPVWNAKLDFIRAHHGLALLNVHPDYLMTAERLALYEAFLAERCEDEGVWRALPAQIAARWRARMFADAVPEHELARVAFAGDELLVLAPARRAG